MNNIIIIYLFILLSIINLIILMSNTLYAKEHNDRHHGYINSSLCDKIRYIISNNALNKYTPHNINIDPRGTKYLDIDLDNDGVSENITCSTGSSESYLDVYLSSGVNYGIEETGAIVLILLQNNLYAIVTYWSSGTIGIGKITEYRIYKITKFNAYYICNIKSRR